MADLPKSLIDALAAPGGGRVVFVLGAGCSAEEPTDLPLSGECSLRAHERLVADGILLEGACADPEDLSIVADAVYAATGGQSALVQRMPFAEFEGALPNNGYLVAAALLLEQVALTAVSLNYDLAIDRAANEIDIADHIRVVCRPDQFGDLGVTNIIHLHRDVHSPWEEWIIRTQQLTEDWKTGWEAIVAGRALTAPVAIFVGLGTPAGVLVETVKAIRKVFEDQFVVLVSPSANPNSRFAKAIHPSALIQAGWGTFMTDLSRSVSASQVDEVSTATLDLVDAQGLPPEPLDHVMSVLKNLNLLELGTVRAEWLLSSRRYRAARGSNPHHMGDLAYGLARVERILRASFEFVTAADGILTREGVPLAFVIPASGEGVDRWAALQAKVRTSGRADMNPTLAPVVALVAGVVGPKDSPLPVDLLVGDEADLVSVAVDKMQFVGVDEIVTNEDLITRMVS